jgi:anaerobic selenocysteine-containing dehydrogenase
MKPTRRDLLALGGGTFAGLLFTPAPWKLLNDSAKWTQNWSWIPQPARGPVDVKYTACALCPNGCGLRVRMAAGWPVGIGGAAGHPVSRGALCPLAFGAHQLNWHPRRLRQVKHRGRSANWDAATAAFQKASSEGPIVIVDGRPGRAASAIYRRFAKEHDGGYEIVFPPEVRTLAPYAQWSGVPVTALAYDLDNARTIVSFGAPVLDGWGGPGLARRWSADADLRLIQIESELSRTASLATEWIAIRPGSEAALAGDLARVLVEEGLVAVRGPISETAAEETGLSPEQVRTLARTIAANGPALAIAADESPAVAALNVVLGAVGARGGIVRKAAAEGPEPCAKPPRVVLIDSTVPWDEANTWGAEVFRFTAWEGDRNSADWLLPAPGFLEEVAEVRGSVISAVETYALSARLAAPPAGVKGLAEFLGASVESEIQARCAALLREGKGTLWRPVDGNPVPIQSVESAAKVYDELLAGAVWCGDRPHDRALRCDLKQWPTAAPSRRGPGTEWSVPVRPPLATKLYQESDLRSEI